MGVYLRAKFEVSSIILASFRQEGNFTPHPTTQNEPLKCPPRLGLIMKYYKPGFLNPLYIDILKLHDNLKFLWVDLVCFLKLMVVFLRKYLFSRSQCDIMLWRIFLHVLNNTSCEFCLSNKKCPELCFTAEAELFCDKKHGESFN